MSKTYLPVILIQIVSLIVEIVFHVYYFQSSVFVFTFWLEKLIVIN